MKKLILLIITVFLTSALIAQVEKSDYEKYWEAKEAAKFGDTVKVAKQVAEKPEYDDLYYTAKDDSLKLLQKELKFARKELRKEKQLTYQNNYYDDETLYYANLISRYHHGSFTFWFDFHYSPFYYNSWYFGYDPFYYNWYSPYYSWHYPYYHNWYYPHYY